MLRGIFNDCCYQFLAFNLGPYARAGIRQQIRYALNLARAYHSLLVKSRLHVQCCALGRFWGGATFNDVVSILTESLPAISESVLSKTSDRQDCHG